MKSNKAIVLLNDPSSGLWPSYNGCNEHKEYSYTVWFTHSAKPDQIECKGITDLGRKVCATLN